MKIQPLHTQLVQQAIFTFAFPINFESALRSLITFAIASNKRTGKQDIDSVLSAPCRHKEYAPQICNALLESMHAYNTITLQDRMRLPHSNLYISFVHFGGGGVCPFVSLHLVEYVCTEHSRERERESKKSMSASNISSCNANKQWGFIMQ
jgi:hypothetical protein